MERRLGHDFGDVRVHADAQAASAARALDADAFTSGADIVFGAGRYRPGAEDGCRLIAHELVHTLQQGRGAATPSLQVSLPAVPDADPLERDAADVAGRVTAGETVPPGTVTIAAPAARGRIARQARAALERVPAEVPDSPESVSAVAGDIARLLVFDPGDEFDRVKRRLARLAPATRAAVATELSGRIPAIAANRLREIVAELLPPGATEPAAEPSTVADESRAPEAADASPAGEPSADGAAGEPSAATAEGREATAGEPSALGEEAAASELSAAGPAEVAPEGIPKPVAEPEGPVAEPELEGEVAPAEPEPEPVAVEEPETEGGDRAAGAVPTPETAEAAGPEEEAADVTAADDTETEALAEQEDSDAEPADAADEAAARAPRPPPEDVGTTSAEEEAPDTLAPEGPEPSGDPEAPVEDPDAEAPAAPEDEPEPQEKESVAEKPPEAGEEATGDEQAVAEPAPADQLADEDPESAAVHAPPEESEEVEPEEPADATLAEEEPAADEEAPVGVGGDEGGAAPIEEPAEQEAPDLSGADPAEAMEAAGTLPPAQSEAALTGVDAAATRSVGAQRSALAEQPPELEKPTGAPTAEELAAESEEAAEPPEAPERIERAPELPAPAPTRVAPLPPAPPPVASRTPAPQIPGGAQGELSEDGRKALQASLRSLPVHDPALDVSAGPAPALALEGAADPQRAHDERAKLESAARSALTDGRRAIIKPAGEQRLVPDVPPERLKAAITPATPAPPPAPPTAAATMAAAEPASIIARQQRGAELRAAAKSAAARMRTRRAEHATIATEERRRSQEQVTQLVRDSAAQQAERRADARGEVHDQRKRWSAAEHELAEGKLTEADARLTTSVEEVTRLTIGADEKAATHIETGERDAETARRVGEKNAAAERKRGEETTSGGVIGWLADQANALFDEIKAGITKVFEIARAAVRDAIEKAKKLAAEAIDFARGAIVAAIRLAGDALIAIGDKLLAGFPGIRDRFRQAIEERVAKAQAAVNALAEGLKNVVQKALDGLGAALDAALGLLEKGLLLMVEGYRAAVAGALKWANGLVKAFAAFAVLVKHVAANPRQWLRNLAASAKDGVKNHLWRAFKAAIKRWFWDKVEEVLGLGLTIWRVLTSGGISLARIGTMAWEGIKAAIPPTLIQILIEKLISLLIPAAAAVMLIVETLQAAWGTVQRVLEAFERFFAFLKAVRTGRAGPHFANAIAAAAIAVIDFVANWLLKRLRRPAGKIAKKLKALAKKLGKKLAKLGKGLFKKRRKKPKVKGKAKKKPKPDKQAQAAKRVAAATDFIGRQLDRGMWPVVLWAQMQYARARWRVRISLREHADDTGTLTISGSSSKKTKLKRKSKPAYAPGILKYQGFLRTYHHRHHLLTGALRNWWNAVKINWNSPVYFLDLPVMLHLRGLHTTLGKLDDARANTISSAFKRKLPDKWNVEWQVWLAPRLLKWVKGKPSVKALKKVLRDDETLRKKVEREVTKEGIEHLLTTFTALTGVPLRRFKVHKTSAARHAKWIKELAKLDKKLAKAKGKRAKKKVLEAWQLKILGGEAKLLAKAKEKWWK
jgi:hypothetical protein